MPRARPGARKTTARRRIQRYIAKMTHHVTPLRVKRLLPHMLDLYEKEEPPFVECEEPTMAELEAKGVPEAEWRYYLGYMKRMLALYRTYTGGTLQLEKTNLIEEYVLREKDRDVLEQVQVVTEICAGVRLSCEDVYACLEGDFSTWTEIWEYDFPQGLNIAVRLSITLSPDYLYISYQDASANTRFVIIKVADASLKFASPVGADYIGNFPYNAYGSFFLYNTLVYTYQGGLNFSMRGKYALICREDYTKIEVWKDGVKMWTSPLASAVVSGATEFMMMALRYDGKYVIALTDNLKLVCFEGS